MGYSISEKLGAVLVIGGGKMGEAIIAGMLAIPGVQPAQITVANPGEAKRLHLSETYGVSCVADASSVKGARTVILSVKPQVIGEVVSAAVAAGSFDEAVLAISVAAGTKTAFLESLLPAGCAVVRVMPNMPLQCGFGTAAVSGGSRATAEQVACVREIFSAAGSAVEVPEDLQDTATALSGSGPAYFALFLDAMAQAGQARGLDYEASYALALDTMYGTAAMLKKTGQGPRELIKAVSSPGGTTIAALDAMKAGGVAEAIGQGVDAAATRSKELSA